MVLRSSIDRNGTGHACFISMPKYHFDLVDHCTAEDHGGQALADDITASDVADEPARRVL